jgi:cytochrome c-type biogenesis protein CcmH/NrfG
MRVDQICAARENSQWGSFLSTWGTVMLFRIATIPAAVLLALGSLSFWQVHAAEVDPTVAQIYHAFKSGHIEQAQQMLDQVLRDHPDSAKAHFVQAEIDAAEGHYELARAQLALAEKLKPGLPNIKPRAVQELKAKLGLPSS